MPGKTAAIVHDLGNVILFLSGMYSQRPNPAREYDSEIRLAAWIFSKGKSGAAEDMLAHRIATEINALNKKEVV